MVEDTKGFANEPLPLGISVKDASGAETVTVTGLAKGTELSLGTSIGPTGWLVSAHDLDKAFVAAPEDFVGIMDATVNLRSTSDQLLDSQAVRFEWIEKKQEGLMPALKPEPTPVLPPLDPEQIATLIKLGQDLLKHGDIMSARLLLKRAAIAGDAQAALELGLTYDRSFWPNRGFSASPRTWVKPESGTIRRSSLDRPRRRSISNDYRACRSDRHAPKDTFEGRRQYALTTRPIGQPIRPLWHTMIRRSHRGD